MSNANHAPADAASPASQGSVPQREAAIIQLDPAPPDWLKNATLKLRQISITLGKASTPDEVMRTAIVGARDILGFNRIGIWLFEEGFRSLTGTFGVDPEGNLSDERGNRIFDHGSIAPQIEAWQNPPYYFLKTDDLLRDSEGGIISKGVHFTTALLQNGEIRGLLAADGLHASNAINQDTGHLLNLYSDLIAYHYFLRIAEANTDKAIASSEHADHIKREFLGMLSHEVRTPLNAILGFAQILCMDSDSPEQEQLARTIEQSGDHLLALLNSMMEYANLADEDLRKRYIPCHPEIIARETVDSFTELANEKNLSLLFQHEGAPYNSVLADPTSLRQILGNLIQNAIKFTESGHIRIKTQTQPKPNGTLAFELTIEDSGCGIEEKDLALIFEPFKQLDSSLTRVHGGIGMGLAIVSRLVSAMSGHIFCNSQVGKGTRFVVDFTFEFAKDAPELVTHHIGTRSASSKSRSELKILIAEDNENNRLLLIALLERLGYSMPDQAVDGAIAAQLIRQRPYDLLLLDLQMPELDGLALTRKVREGACGSINADAPIVGLTAHNLTYDRPRARAAGMNEYLLKPFKPEDLDATIQKLVSSSSTRA